MFRRVVQVLKAIDTESNDKTVAIKIQLFEGEQKVIIDEEYRILRDYSEHPNLPNFYGVYRNKGDGKSDEIWFILEVNCYFIVIELCTQFYLTKR